MNEPPYARQQPPGRTGQIASLMKPPQTPAEARETVKGVIALGRPERRNP